MKQLLLLLAALSGALAGALRERRDSSHECNCPSPYGGAKGSYWGGGFHGRSAFSDPAIAEGRAESQDARLDRLEEEVEKAQHDYEALAAGKGERVSRFENLGDRVWDLEAHHCDAAHFSCRDNVFTCVSHNAVCDNSQDCLNGRDENEHTCTVVSGVGSVFEGHIVDADHCTTRKPDTFRFAISSVDIADAFPQEPQIKATVLSSKDDGEGRTTASLNSNGIYDYTHRTLILYSPDADGLVFECTFPPHNNDYCKGVLRRDSGAICATFGLSRVD